MKKSFFHFFLSLGILGFLASCDNDFSVSDDWSDVTVVYSLLDPAADTNWVRIERGYLGSAPARDSYGISDSLYYDSLVVYLLEFDANGNKLDSFYLERDNTSRGRAPGVFTSNDYRLYRTTEEIDKEFIYELNVKQTDAKFTDAKARTEIVGGQIEGNFFDFGFRIPRDVLNFPSEFSGKVEIDASERAEIYQVYFTFNYKEYDITTKEEESKSIFFQYATLSGDAAQADPITFNTPFSTFNSSIAQAVPIDDNKLRFVEDMVIEVYAGGADLQRYMALNEPTNNVNQNKPEFPGIENGTGLFSSRTKIRLEDVDFPRGSSGSGPYTTFYDQFYLSGILCERNFVKLSSSDTLVCKVLPGGTRAGRDYKQ